CDELEFARLQHRQVPGLRPLENLSPSRLATSSWKKILMPVILPPGRARLATSPKLTGFSLTTKTIGIVVVAALTASAPALTRAAITATRRLTRSAMSDGRRLYWPSSQSYSTITFWPSI